MRLPPTGQISAHLPARQASRSPRCSTPSIQVVEIRDLSDQKPILDEPWKQGLGKTFDAATLQVIHVRSDPVTIP